jgi:hypothetical protein
VFEGDFGREWRIAIEMGVRWAFEEFRGRVVLANRWRVTFFFADKMGGGAILQFSALRHPPLSSDPL